MDQTHLHLMITHLPIVGSVLGALVLIHGMWSKSEQTKIAAYNLFILSSMGCVLAYFSGEEAEETVEKIQGISKAVIEDHSDFAIYPLINLILLGVASLSGIYFSWVKSPFSKTISILILLLSLIGFGLLARTGYLGGQIVHGQWNAANKHSLQQDEAEIDD